MSGLDPLGRRDVRALILRLRDRGCTVFFSSHVLSDAEALCSRVAILAKGRLVTEGRLHELLAFRVRGWELVVGNVSDGWLRRTRSATRPARRWTIHHRSARSSLPPDRVLAEISAGGCVARVDQSDSRHARRLLCETDEARRLATAAAERAAGGAHETWRPGSRVNVFRESVRDKVLYNLVAFAILLMGASYLIGQLTAGQDVKIIKDLGLAATSIFGLFIAVFIGIGLVSKEVERRSIYGLLAKPIERYQVILGKYAGLVLTLFVNLAVMAAALYLSRGDMRWVHRPRPSAPGCAALRSGDAVGRRPHLRGTVGRHRHRVVLFHVFDTHALRRVHVRPLCGRPLQCRSSNFNRWSSRRLLRLAQALSGSCRIFASYVRALSRPGRARSDTWRSLPRTRRLHRGAPGRVDGDLRATRLQISGGRGPPADCRRHCLGGAAGCRGVLQATREQKFSPRHQKRSTSRPARSATGRGYTRWRPTCTGSGQFSTTAATSDDRGGSGWPDRRPALPTTTRCSTRSSTSRRRSIRCSTWPIASAPCFWPSRGPRRRTARFGGPSFKRACTLDPISGSTCRTSGS